MVETRKLPCEYESYIEGEAEISEAKRRVFEYATNVVDAMGSKEKVLGTQVKGGTLVNEDPFLKMNEIRPRSLTAGYADSTNKTFVAAYYPGEDQDLLTDDLEEIGHPFEETASGIISKILTGWHVQVDNSEMVEMHDKHPNSYTFYEPVETLAQEAGLDCSLEQYAERELVDPEQTI